jgi:hypothetical protein
LGIERLTVLCAAHGFRGQREELVLETPDGTSFKHTAGGLGGTYVGLALSRAASLGFIAAQDGMLIPCIKDLVARSVTYHGNQGKWLVPSDENGPPRAWNSAFAIDALLEFETAYLTILHNGAVEKSFVAPWLEKVNLWKRVSATLCILIALFLIVQYTPRIWTFSSWFNAQSALVQGVLMIFIGFLIERALALVMSLAARLGQPKKRTSSANA